MGDLPNIEKNRAVIEGPTGNDLKVDSNGSLQARLFDASAALIGQKTMAGSLPIVLASDQSVVPVQDVSSLYASQDKLYSISSEINLAGTGEVDAFLFRNPSGSGKVVYLTKLIACLISSVGAEVRIRIYRTPTITANGTAITISPARIGGSPPASISLCNSLPTISARGTLIRVFNSANTSTFTNDINSRIIVEANNSFLITGQSTSTNKPLGLNLAWVEL